MNNQEELNQACREIAELKIKPLYISEFKYGSDESSSQKCIVSLNKCSLLKELKVYPEDYVQTLESKLSRAIELIDCNSGKWGRCNCRSCQFLETLRKGGQE